MRRISTDIAAKTAEPHAKLPGTIHSAAEAIRAAGGEAPVGAQAGEVLREELAADGVEDGVHTAPVRQLPDLLDDVDLAAVVADVREPEVAGERSGDGPLAARRGPVDGDQ